MVGQENECNKSGDTYPTLIGLIWVICNLITNTPFWHLDIYSGKIRTSISDTLTQYGKFESGGIGELITNTPSQQYSGKIRTSTADTPTEY
jgi:hypothetical protein